MQVFKARWYYHWQLQGSYSIKKVLPALVPEMSYANLNIAEGASAARSYSELLTIDKEKAEQIKQSLLEYCRLDTLAMVEIFRFIANGVK